MSKYKVAKCDRCGRMAHSGKHAWWAENTIWKWVGLPDSAVLCRDCFEQDVCNKLGSPASNGGLWETLTVAALAGLLPLSSGRVAFANIGPTELPQQLTAAVGLEIWRTESIMFGLRKGESKAVRFGPLQREGDHMILAAPQKQE